MIEPHNFSSASTQEWETALEVVNDGVCLLGADGYIRRCNPAAVRVLGGDHDAIIGRPADEVLSDAFGHIHPERVQYLDKSPPPQTVEVIQDDRHFRLTLLPVLDGGGALAGSALTISDITDGRRLLEEEQLSERLRDEASRVSTLEQLKSQFLRLASHELRSPVAVLSGYVSLLADGSLGELPEPARAAMPVMLAKLAEMNQLVDQLLDTARLEDSRLALRLEIVDLRDVARKAVEAIQPLAIASHELVLNVPRERAVVHGDSARLRTIVTNLLENAIKYSPDGGDVECTVSIWDGRGTITVRDHGIGMDPSQLDVLFTRFGRLLTNENEHIAGTGLGLYLSRELARMHGGDLTVESELGEGSAFTLRLPLAESTSNR